eukprot:Opistho-2@46295
MGCGSSKGADVQGGGAEAQKTPNGASVKTTVPQQAAQRQTPPAKDDASQVGSGAPPPAGPPLSAPTVGDEASANAGRRMAGDGGMRRKDSGTLTSTFVQAQRKPSEANAVTQTRSQESFFKMLEAKIKAGGGEVPVHSESEDD